MATIEPAEVKTPFDGPARLFKWVLAAGDTAAYLRLPIKADKTVQVYGTFGGGSVSLEGTLEEDDAPVNPFILNDSRGEGNPLTFSAADGRTVHEAVVQIRPALAGGAGPITVRLLAVAATGGY